MAPSIFASSDSRGGVNSASSRKPPEHTDSTSGPEPTTISAPIRADMIRSMPARNGEPGRRQTQGGEHLVGTHGRHHQAWPHQLHGAEGPGYCGGDQPVRAIGRSRAAERANAAGERRSHGVDADRSRTPAARGNDAGPTTRVKPETSGLGDPQVRVRHATHLAAEADLADHHRARRRSPGSSTTPATAASTARSMPGLGDAHATGNARVDVGAPGVDRRRGARARRAAATAGWRRRRWRRVDHRRHARRRGPAPPRASGARPRRWPRPPTPPRRVAVGEEQCRRVGDREEAVPRSSRRCRPRGWSRTGACSARRKRSPWWRSPSNEHTVSTTCSMRARPRERSVLRDVAHEDRWPSPCSRARRVSRDAHSRTWVTDPGVPGRSGSSSVCTESTARTSGRTASTWATTCGSDDSATSHRSGSSDAQPLGPAPDLLGDSSAPTSRQRATRRGEAAEGLEQAAWTCRSPARRRAAWWTRAVNPPPSTRSSSPIPVARRGSPDLGRPRRSVGPRRVDPGDRRAGPPPPRPPPASPMPRSRGSGRATAGVSAPHSAHRWRLGSGPIFGRHAERFSRRVRHLR